MIAYELEINKDTVQKIIVEDLKKKKFAYALYCMHWLQNRRRTKLLHVKI